MSSGNKAPQGYQPTGQPVADQNYQALTNNFANSAQTLSSTAIPGLQGIYDSISNNPYYTQAQTGANDAAGIGMGYVAPGAFAGAQQDMNLGATSAEAAGGALQQGQTAFDQSQALGAGALQQGQTAYTQAQQQSQDALNRGLGILNTNTAMLPQVMSTYGTTPDLMTNASGSAATLRGAEGQATAGLGMAMPILQDALQKGQITWEQAQSLMPLVTAGLPAAQSILNTGFDPQRALYDRSYQQMQQQENAGAAQQGLSGSPFAAGLANDASRNFNIDWQNNQLGRETQALGAFDSATSNAANIYSTLAGAGGGGYSGLVNSGVGNFDALTSTATSNLRGLEGDASGMISNALQGQFSNQQTSSNNAINQYQTLLNSGLGAYNAGQSGAQNWANIGQTALNSGQGAAQNWAGIGQTALNSGTSNFNTLSQGAQNATANAADLGQFGLNTMTTASQYPNAIYVQQQQQILQALQAMIQGTSASLAPTQQAIQDEGGYMNIGQNATQLAQNATSINNAASAATWQGIGQLAGLAMAPFTGGASLAVTAGAT